MSSSRHEAHSSFPPHFFKDKILHSPPPPHTPSPSTLLFREGLHVTPYPGGPDDLSFYGVPTGGPGTLRFGVRRSPHQLPPPTGPGWGGLGEGALSTPTPFTRSAGSTTENRVRFGVGIGIGRARRGGCGGSKRNHSPSPFPFERPGLVRSWVLEGPEEGPAAPDSPLGGPDPHLNRGRFFFPPPRGGGARLREVGPRASQPLFP